MIVQHPGLDLGYFRPGECDGVDGEAPFRVLFVGARFSAKVERTCSQPCVPDWRQERRIWTSSLLMRFRRSRESPSTGWGVMIRNFSSCSGLRLPVSSLIWRCRTVGRTGGDGVRAGRSWLARGGDPEFLDAGRAGIIVEPGELNELRAALASLIEDRPAARELGAAARARCEAHYDARSNTAQLMELARAIAGSA